MSLTVVTDLLTLLSPGCRAHLSPAWPLRVRLFGAQQAQHTTGEKDVVGARSGNKEEGTTGPVHTEAALVADLVPSAT